LSVEASDVAAGDAIGFDASNSSDDEAVVEYRWDFDGDGEIDSTTESPTVNHAYEEVGTYVPVVTVVDADGNASNATALVVVEEREKAHPGDGNSGGGNRGGNTGSTNTGPPPVDVDAEQTGPNSGSIDVQNARDDEIVRSDLPESEVASETGVRFQNVAVNLSADDAHFVVETARSAEGSPPADVTLGSLAVKGTYVEDEQVAGVTYDVEIQESRLDEEGVEAADLTAYQRTGDGWTVVNATVEERDGVVVLSVETDALAPIAVGAERSVTITDVRLADEEVAADEQVAVTATFHNEDDEAEEFAANLTVDGTVVATKTVDVPAGETKEVTVETALEPGTYEVGFDGQSVGSVTVAEPVAEVGVADVALNASTIAVGEQVAITATVENTGSKAGEQTVALTLFGEQVATETVEIPAGETREVTFVRQVDSTGTYTAKVGGETATFEVTEQGEGDDGPKAPDVPVPGFGVGVALLSLVAVALLARVRG
jgi:PGF-CTERM protein